MNTHPIPAPPILPPLRIGNVTPPSRFSLAPLAGYTMLAYRQAVRELGGLGMATTDLVNPRAILQSSRRTVELLRTCPTDRPLAVQIYGSEAGVMCEAAQWLQAYGATVVDINMGCPVHKVCKNGGGSAMMCDPAATVALVRTIVESVTIPVTVKMRLGWDDSAWSAPFFAREFEQAGVGAVTIHGRTREQAFKGQVNHDGIRAVVEAVERIPVIGNGDVRSVADAAHMLHYTGCAGIAIGRGSLLNPWLFLQLQEWEAGRTPAVRGNWQQHLDFMVRHLHLLAEHRGDYFGCITFRKVANWYCRVLKPGREIQQRMIRLESVAEFDEMVDRMRSQKTACGVESLALDDLAIPVPQGPTEHW